jgi:FkbM family methyltransferase
MLKTAIKSLAGILGLTIIRSDALRKYNPFAEQKRLVDLGSLTIFDVGAYIGEISKVYAELFPTAQVYSFEPFFGSFEQLKRNMVRYPNVHVYNMGLSDRGGRQQLYSNTFDATNSLLEPSPAADKTWGKGVVQAQALIESEFTTLDEFIEKNNIAEIDILKMDVQGAETRVLTGADKALKEGRIALIYSEVITMPTYKNQKKLWEILRAFDEYGMDLHNVYDLEFQDDGTMTQFDAIFVRRCPKLPTFLTRDRARRGAIS